MTTSDLERRLADLLHERAEGAMTKTHTQEKLSSLLADRGDAQRRRRWAAGGLAAAAALVAVAVWTGRGDVDRTEQLPGDGSEPVAIASSFIRSSYAYELDRAEGMLSTDVDMVDPETLDKWRDQNAWYEAAGFSVTDLSCREESTSSAGTEVHCTFALRGMGSEHLGVGPYGGNTFDLTVLDGEITSVKEYWPFEENGFSDEMWEPFADWIQQTHPDDADVMYTDASLTEPRPGPTSMGLWELRVRQYAELER